jgi:hypothetical protein
MGTYVATQNLSAIASSTDNMVNRLVCLLAADAIAHHIDLNDPLIQAAVLADMNTYEPIPISVSMARGATQKAAARIYGMSGYMQQCCFDGVSRAAKSIGYVNQAYVDVKTNATTRKNAYVAAQTAYDSAYIAAQNAAENAKAAATAAAIAAAQDPSNQDKVNAALAAQQAWSAAIANIPVVSTEAARQSALASGLSNEESALAATTLNVAMQSAADMIKNQSGINLLTNSSQIYAASCLRAIIDDAKAQDLKSYDMPNITPNIIASSLYATYSGYANTTNPSFFEAFKIAYAVTRLQPGAEDTTDALSNKLAWQLAYTANTFNKYIENQLIEHAIKMQPAMASFLGLGIKRLVDGFVQFTDAPAAIATSLTGTRAKNAAAVAAFISTMDVIANLYSGAWAASTVYPPQDWMIGIGWSLPKSFDEMFRSCVYTHPYYTAAQNLVCSYVNRTAHDATAYGSYHNTAVAYAKNIAFDLMDQMIAGRMSTQEVRSLCGGYMKPRTEASIALQELTTVVRQDGNYNEAITSNGVSQIRDNAMQVYMPSLSAAVKCVQAIDPTNPGYVELNNMTARVEIAADATVKAVAALQHTLGSVTYEAALAANNFAVAAKADPQAWASRLAKQAEQSAKLTKSTAQSVQAALITGGITAIQIADAANRAAAAVANQTNASAALVAYAAAYTGAYNAAFEAAMIQNPNAMAIASAAANAAYAEQYQATQTVMDLAKAQENIIGQMGGWGGGNVKPAYVSPLSVTAVAGSGPTDFTAGNQYDAVDAIASAALAQSAAAAADPASYASAAMAAANMYYGWGELDNARIMRGAALTASLLAATANPLGETAQAIAAIVSVSEAAVYATNAALVTAYNNWQQVKIQAGMPQAVIMNAENLYYETGNYLMKLYQLSALQVVQAGETLFKVGQNNAYINTAAQSSNINIRNAAKAVLAANAAVMNSIQKTMVAVYNVREKRMQYAIYAKRQDEAITLAKTAENVLTGYLKTFNVYPMFGGYYIADKKYAYGVNPGTQNLQFDKLGVKLTLIGGYIENSEQAWGYYTKYSRASFIPMLRDFYIANASLTAPSFDPVSYLKDYITKWEVGYLKYLDDFNTWSTDVNLYYNGLERAAWYRKLTQGYFKDLTFLFAIFDYFFKNADYISSVETGWDLYVTEIIESMSHPGEGLYFGFTSYALNEYMILAQTIKQSAMIALKEIAVTKSTTLGAELTTINTSILNATASTFVDPAATETTIEAAARKELFDTLVAAYEAAQHAVDVTLIEGDLNGWRFYQALPYMLSTCGMTTSREERLFKSIPTFVNRYGAYFSTGNNALPSQLNTDTQNLIAPLIAKLQSDQATLKVVTTKAYNAWQDAIRNPNTINITKQADSIIMQPATVAYNLSLRNVNQATYGIVKTDGGSINEAVISTTDTTTLRLLTSVGQNTILLGDRSVPLTGSSTLQDLAITSPSIVSLKIWSGSEPVNESGFGYNGTYFDQWHVAGKYVPSNI